MSAESDFNDLRQPDTTRKRVLAAMLAPAVGDGPITQDGIALQFAQMHAGTLCYCHTTGAWFRWANTHWQQDTERLAFNYVRELARSSSQISKPQEQKAARSAQFASGVERFAQADPLFAVTGEFWDRNPWLLGTPGGTVDLRTGQVRRAAPDDGISRITTVAPAEASNCEAWQQFLAEVTANDNGMQRFLQQWCGYGLTGDIREQSLVFAHGGGGNGKGTFVNTVSGIMGGYAVTAAMDTFTASKFSKHTTDLAMLKGARMVTASETEEGHAWAEARIKQITGGDAITARFMRQNNFTYIPQFKLTIIGNHKPALKNIDDAMRRRFSIVPFLVKPAVPDTGLAERLKVEWPAILRWMIEGCLDWQKSGLVRPQSVVEDTEAYFTDQDVFGQWLDDCCEVNRGRHWLTAASVLYRNWRDYALGAGEESGSMKAFSTRLEQQHLEKRRTMKVRGFLGIRLKQADFDDEGRMTHDAF